MKDLKVPKGLPRGPVRATSGHAVRARTPFEPIRRSSSHAMHATHAKKSSNKRSGAASRRDFRRFQVDFGIDFGGFSSLRHASRSTRSTKARTFIFADRHSTFKGLLTLQQHRKSITIDRKSLRLCFANAPRNKNSMFFIPGRDLASILVASARYQALPGALSDVSAHPLEPSRRSWDVPGTAPDAPETPPERSWAAWSAPRGSQDRFLFFCVAPATLFHKQPYFV